MGAATSILEMIDYKNTKGFMFATDDLPVATYGAAKVFLRENGTSISIEISGEANEADLLRQFDEKFAWPVGGHREGLDYIVHPRTKNTVLYVDNKLSHHIIANFKKKRVPIRTSAENRHLKDATLTTREYIYAEVNAGKEVTVVFLDEKRTPLKNLTLLNSGFEADVYTTKKLPGKINSVIKVYTNYDAFSQNLDNYFRLVEQGYRSSHPLGPFDFSEYMAHVLGFAPLYDTGVIVQEYLKDHRTMSDLELKTQFPKVFGPLSDPSTRELVSMIDAQGKNFMVRGKNFKKMKLVDFGHTGTFSVLGTSGLLEMPGF